MKVFFHVVTSVKGGSGKSTVALLLADYLLSKGKEAYVIDLDVCGTSWYTDYKFAYNGEPTKFINRMMYQNCTKGYGDNVWSKLKVKGTGDGQSNQLREITVCLAANEQLSHAINKSEAELVEHTTYHLIKDVIYGSSGVEKKEEVHIIFDLPPSHETTVEQICHHLLFDQRSVLKRDLVKDEVAYQVYFYLISPADQGSALKKNIGYLKELESNPTYSESMKNEEWYAWLIINDNHNWVGVQGGTPATMLEGLKNVAIELMTNEVDISNKQVLAMEYYKFGYKKGNFFGEFKAAELGFTGLDVSDDDKNILNISGYETKPFDDINNRLAA
jgi:hypothetical protein